LALHDIFQNDTMPYFDIQSEPISAAIVAIAVQSDVAIGGVNPKFCGEQRKSLVGRMSPTQAFTTLLENSHCSVEALNGSTFVLRYHVTRVTPPRVQQTPLLAPAARPPRSRAAIPRAPQRAAIPPTVPPARHSAPNAPILPQPLETILVTGKRAGAAGQQSTFNSIVGGSELTGGQGSLADVAARIANFSVTNLGAGRNKLMLRGVSDGVITGRAQASVALYLDDAPITYNAPDPDLLLTDIQQVEVLRGPQGALYGEGAISGVVRIITKKPNLAESDTSISAKLGVSANGDPSSRIEIITNQVLVPQRGAWRGAFYYERLGGYIDDIAIPATNSNASTRAGGRISVGWQVNENWSVTGTLVNQAINTTNSHYVSGNFGPYRRAVGQLEPHDNDFVEVSGVVDGTLPWGRVKIAINRLNHEVVTTYAADPIAPNFAIPAGLHLSFSEDQQIALSTYEVSLKSRPASALPSGWQWLIGAYATSGEERFKPQFVTPADGRQWFAETRSDAFFSGAAFGEATYDLTPKWSVTLAARLSQASHQFQSSTRRGLVASANPVDVQTGKRTDVKLSEKLAITYRPFPTLSLYVQSSEGYRDGGFNSTWLTAVDLTNRRYQGDELINSEIGGHFTSTDRQVRVSFAAYRIAWSAIQGNQVQSNGLPITLNSGDGTLMGLETEGSFALSPTWDASFAGQWNDADIGSQKKEVASGDLGSFAAIPRYSLGASLNYHAPLGQGDLTGRISYNYQGPSSLTINQQSGQSMDAFGTLAFGVRYDLPNWTYEVQVASVAPKHVNTLAYGNPFTYPTTNQSTPLRPATIWLSLKRRVP
jgi:iron complex outermembrane recepter protein